MEKNSIVPTNPEVLGELKKAAIRMQKPNMLIPYSHKCRNSKNLLVSSNTGININIIQTHWIVFMMI
ncbi:unnamed protein product [Moneuplotes crassus]|uniref:Uncharacterized protein n=1 Tax=Euplotes crassus TaxID=5936 RepID=A0AAD2D9H1_EUPCR|nr:unnamed protein product [Moneuplotes crassus]